MDIIDTGEKKFKTAHLPTNEEKIAKLDSLLRKRKRKGEFFLPDTDFYSLDLNDMAEAMLHWVGIHTKDKIYISYASDFEASGLQEAAGIYKELDGVHYIFLNTAKVHNGFQAAAVLAHELMHYILMGVGHFMLEETLENEKLTDIATVFTGLGVVVTNGFEYQSRWAETVGALMFGMIHVNTQSLSFGYYKPGEYSKMLKDFGDSFDINPGEYAGYLLPWTRHFLPGSLKVISRATNNRSDMVNIAQKRVWKQRAVQVVVLLVLLPLAILFFSILPGSSGSSIPTDVQNQLDTQKSQIDSLKNQVDSCSSDLNAQRDSVNQYDSASVDSYNADLANCKSLQDEYNTEVDSYNATVKQYR